MPDTVGYDTPAPLPDQQHSSIPTIKLNPVDDLEFGNLQGKMVICLPMNATALAIGGLRVSGAEVRNQNGTLAVDLTQCWPCAP